MLHLKTAKTEEKKNSSIC